MEISMRRFIQKYFSSELPEREQMYHLFCILSILGFGFCFYMSMFFMIEPLVRVLLLAGAVTGFCLFLMDVSEPEKMRLGVLSLYCIHIIIYPSYYLLTKGHPVSVPIYFVFALVLSAYMLEGRLRLIGLGVDILVFGLTFLLAEYTGLHAEKIGNQYLRQTDYILIYVAVVINGLSCAVIAYYKNRVIHDEIARNYEATEEARNAGYAKDIFLVNVSHDIRTPLNAIIGTCELTLDKEINEEVQDNMNQILNFSKALLSITNNLLDFSKLDESAIEVKEEEYDTVEFMEEIINMFSVQLLDTGIEFYSEIDATIPKKLYGDPDKLRQIMVNLISNAVKYTKEGYITLRVLNTPIDVTKCRLLFEVADTGIGIRSEEQRCIFEPFIRGEDVKDETTGFGLGLANCKVIAESMNGSIKVESNYGKGSVFSVSVPQKIKLNESIATLDKATCRAIIFEEDARQADNLQFIFRQLKQPYLFVHSMEEFQEKLKEDEYTHAFFSQNYMNMVKDRIQDEKLMKKLVLISKRNTDLQLIKSFPVLTRPIHVMTVVEAITGTKNLAKKRANRYSPFKCPTARVMVVDDNQINLQVAGGMLEKISAQVVTVLSGKECLKKLETEEFDLIFMDYMMPEMDGIDTLKNIKRMNNPKVLSIPVIALTANAVSGSKEMFLEAGFDDYISKPIDRKAFYAVVKKYIPQEKIEVE